jgi:hypothetical protein
MDRIDAMKVFVTAVDEKSAFCPHLQGGMRIVDCPAESVGDLDWTHV